MCIQDFGREKLEKHHFADPDIDGRIVLKWILRKWVGRSGIELMWLRIGSGRRALVNAVLNFWVT
jgi:hypothetical protein